MVFLGSSMEPPLCTKGRSGYLMQLNVTHDSVATFFSVELSLYTFTAAAFELQTNNHNPLIPNH